MQGNQLSAFRIMIVDDEKTIHKLVYDVLLSLGFRDITTADSGRKAIHLASIQKFDFIITDWRMGDMDGIDLVRFVRTSPDCPYTTTPIIMLTGNTEAHYVTDAVKAGVNGYLIKPFSAEQLVKRIRAIIEYPRSFVLASTYRGPNRRTAQKQLAGKTDRRTNRKTQAQR